MTKSKQKQNFHFLKLGTKQNIQHKKTHLSRVFQVHHGRVLYIFTRGVLGSTDQIRQRRGHILHCIDQQNLETLLVLSLYKQVLYLEIGVWVYSSSKILQYFILITTCTAQARNSILFNYYEMSIYKAKTNSLSKFLKCYKFKIS